MRSELAIEIAAPAALVFQLARDVSRWPNLLAHYVAVSINELRPDGSVVATMVARRPLGAVLGLGIPVTWKARAWHEPETRRLRFHHVAGATRGMDVTWRIESTAGGCRVTIEHVFRPRVPLFAAFVDRWFIRPIAGRTLSTFKDLAEALVDDSSVESESERSPSTNPSM